MLTGAIQTLFAIRALCWLLFLFATEAMGQSLGQGEEGALLSVYGSEAMIKVVTGIKQPLTLAPAVATVITANDIKEMGATDLDEVLETVPGLHVAKSSRGYNPIYTFRGIFSQYNSQVLVLINSIPITNLFFGARSLVWGGMPVQAIDRIEVIRGPGSATYGANAFAGVINIITKTAQDINGTEIGGRVGSFNAWDGWFLHGGAWAGFDIALMVEYGDTEGQQRIIDADAQTFFDNWFGTKASLAPGPVNLQRKNLDVRLDIARGNWRLRAGLQRRWDGGTGAGIASALDPHGQFASNRWNADLTYHDPTFMSRDWGVTAQLSYLDTSQEATQNVKLFPPGTEFGVAPGVDFPKGVIGNPEVFERHFRSKLIALYRGFEQHTLRGGIGFRYGNLYRVEETKNYFQGLLDHAPQPLGSLMDVTNNLNYVFLQPHDRKDYYFFLQDVWNFANDWELTAGMRYDYFSDFGQTINPRVALVWNTRYNLTTKLLFGRAFRAPSFAELYNQGNPVALGNSHLYPETITTSELAFDYRPSQAIRLALSLFHYRWDDIIQFVPIPETTGRRAQNIGKQTGYGLELEAAWKLTDNFKLIGNYAFQHSVNQVTDETAPYAPHHQIYLRGTWEFLPGWYLNPQLNWIIDRSRAADDSRPEIDDYSIVDLTLRRKARNDPWEIAFSVRNLFDTDAREPSLSPLIPHDLPLAGRSFFGEVRIHF